MFRALFHSAKFGHQIFRLAPRLTDSKTSLWPVIRMSTKADGGDSVTLSWSVDQVEGILNKVAPLDLAASWDNVGLLIEPSFVPKIDKILLCVDLTESVLNDAIDSNVHFIVAYHPTIFHKFRSLKIRNPSEQTMIRCIENKIAVYSPHTALDAIHGGLNDFLLSGFDVKQRAPVEQSFIAANKLKPVGYKYSLSFFCQNEAVLERLAELNCQMTSYQSNYLLQCNDEYLAYIIRLLEKHNIQIKSLSEHPKLPLLDNGMGKLATLTTAIKISTAINTVKETLNLDHVSVGYSNSHSKGGDSMIETIAVCAGSGYDLLKDVKADLIVTGELKHHEILEFKTKGTSVIVCGHSNSERAFVNVVYRQLLIDKLNIPVLISQFDTDPLTLH